MTIFNNEEFAEKVLQTMKDSRKAARQALIVSSMALPVAIIIGSDLMITL